MNVKKNRNLLLQNYFLPEFMDIQKPFKTIIITTDLHNFFILNKKYVCDVFNFKLY